MKAPQVIAYQPMEAVGPTLPLFDGQQLRGWRILSGNWIVPRDEPVISGNNGTLQRVFFKRGTSDPSAEPADPQSSNAIPVAHYKLDMVFELRTADSISLHFGLTPADDIGHTVRFTSTECDAGGDGPRPFDGTRPHALTLERQPTGWFVKLDNTICGSWITGSQDLPEIRISVAGGPAWFSDIYFTELRSRQDKGLED